MLTKLYDKVLAWSRHKHAEFYLGAMSFAESSFFPIPPDVMLAPMSLAQPKRAWYFAALTTVTSTIGGMLGYLIGWLAFTSIEPSLIGWGYGPTLAAIKQQFVDNGVIFVFVAGFTPFPYKLITITAGAMSMSFLPFVLASMVGRGGRFFLVAGAMKFGGKPMEDAIRKYINILSLVLILALVALYLIYR